MKFRKILVYTSLALVIGVAGCKKAAVDGGGEIIPPVVVPPVVVPPVEQPYIITEGFEGGNKPGYAVADATLTTGSWKFDDALIGNIAGDAKNGNWSVRLKTGSLSMNFDINGVSQISIKHAKYGSDAAGTWQLSMSTDGGTTYTNLGSPITETSTTLSVDSFAVTATSKVRFKITKTSATIRVNLDDITFKGKGEPGIVVGTPDTQGPDTTKTSSSTTPRGVTLGADAPPTSGDNSNLLFGNPSSAQTSAVMLDNYLIDQGYYVESYNSTKATPNWVSWHLDATNITNVSDRLNNFAAFNGLPGGWYAVQSNSYSFATYGFDRGHNCPSADRSSSANANSSTFLMTNMIPQAPQNNQQSWAKLENFLRAKVVEGNEVYIIMGSYGTGGTGAMGAFNAITDGVNKITVPANVWKIAVIIPAGTSDAGRVTSSTRVIAVNTPNNNSIATDWKQYIVSVRDIETATGYNLLSNLPQAVQDAIETKKDAGN